MPLCPIMFSSGGTLPSDLQEKLHKMFESIDKNIPFNAQYNGVSMKDVRIAHPLNYVVCVSVNTTIIIATDKNVGTPSIRYIGSLNTIPYNKQELINEVERAMGYEDIFTIEFPTAYILYKDENEMTTNAALIAKSYIDDVKYQLSIRDKMLKQKSIFNNNDFIINEQLVFVVCPFKDEFNAIYEDQIKAVVESEMSMQCIRADEIYSNGPIIEDIWRLINEARVIVADLTERNPNVFYEVGLAHAIGKEVILLAQDVNDIPFDLRHLRTIIYKNDFRGQNALHESLKKTILNFK